MRKNKEKREPLMYIHQPKFIYPELEMQSTYHSKDEPLQAESSQLKDEPPQVDKEQTSLIHEAVKKEKPMLEKEIRREKERKPANAEQELPTEEPKTVKERPAWMGLRPVKRFHDMEMDEKLQHLTEQYTSLPCLFDCDTESHKGLLQEVTPDVIKVKTFKGETVTVERKHLKHIRMLGPF